MSKTRIAHDIILAFVSIALVALVVVPVIDNCITPSESDDIYVFVLTGQSNSAYYSYDVDVANAELPHIEQGKAYYYGTAEKPIYYGISPTQPIYDITFESYAIHDMVDSNGDYVIGNIEAAFASEFVKETGKKIAIINTGIGGQSIAQMMPGQLGNDWNDEVFTRAIAGVEALGYNVKYGSLLFIQGETDTSMAVNTYKADFEAMLNSYTETTSCETLILSLVRPVNAVNSSTAQIQLAEELSNVYMGSTASTTFTVANGLMDSDNLHYSQYGDDIIGPQLAECYINTVNPAVISTEDRAISSLVGIIPALIIMAVLAAFAGNLYFRSKSDI